MSCCCQRDSFFMEHVSTYSEQHQQDINLVQQYLGVTLVSDIAIADGTSIVYNVLEGRIQTHWSFLQRVKSNYGGIIFRIFSYPLEIHWNKISWPLDVTSGHGVAVSFWSHYINSPRQIQQDDHNPRDAYRPWSPIFSMAPSTSSYQMDILSCWYSDSNTSSCEGT